MQNNEQKQNQTCNENGDKCKTEGANHGCKQPNESRECRNKKQNKQNENGSMH